MNEYVYYLPELYQIKSEVAPGLYRIQGCISGGRKVATEDTLSSANIKHRADITVTQLVGLRQEIELIRAENSTLKEQIYSEGSTANRREDEARRLIQQLELDVKTQRDKIRRLNEDLEKQRTLVKSERAKAKVTEKLIRDLKQKNLHQRPFTLYEILLVSETADEETIRRNYKKLAAMTHPDVGGCEEHFKSIFRAFSILSCKAARDLYDVFGVEKAEEELSRRNNWSE